MKKSGILLIIAALILALGCFGAVHAEIVPPYGPGQQIGYPAVVLCDTLTLYEEPSSDSKAVQTLNYRDTPIAVNADLPEGPMVENGFVYCVLGDSEDSPCGWISMEFIIINPAWYVTEAKTPVYAWNDTSAPRVALLDKNTSVPAFLEPDTYLPILKEEGDWLLVSLRGAVGWIRK